METTPRNQNAPGADKRAGRPFRVGDVVAAEEPEQTKPEPTQAPDAPAVIGIRYPASGIVVTYEAAEIEEGAHCFKLFAKGVGEAKGQLVAIYNKHTGAIIEAAEPVAIERVGYVDNSPDYIPETPDAPPTGTRSTGGTEPGFWSKLFGRSKQ